MISGLDTSHPASVGFGLPMRVGFHLESPHSLNRYAFVWNNPLRYVDPDGYDAIDLIGNRAINQMIGDSQRELLKDFFQSGKAPEGLTQRTLQLYKEVAKRAIAADKDQLGVQAEQLANDQQRSEVDYGGGKL